MSWHISKPESPSIHDIIWTEFNRISKTENILLSSPYDSGDYLHVDHDSLQQFLDLDRIPSEGTLSQIDPFLVVLRDLSHGGRTTVLDNEMVDEVPEDHQAPCVLRFDDQNPYREKILKQEDSEPPKKQNHSREVDPETGDDVRGNKNNLINGPM